MKRNRNIIAIASECAKSLSATVKIAELVKQFQQKNIDTYLNQNANFLTMVKTDFQGSSQTMVNV